MLENRTRWLSTLLALALTTIATQLASAQPNPTAPAQGRQLDLRQQLTIGLRATTRSDFAFIDSVVLAVAQGRLPRTIVDTTFLWARDRAARRSYLRRLRPFVYFQPGLTERARRIGVLL